MYNIKLVIVPAWLDLIMKELGITNDDLVDWEKLSGILSPRDLLIYKMLNWNACEVIARLPGCNEQVASKLISELPIATPVPTLEERAFCANQSVDVLIYGATCVRDKEQQLYAQAYMSDSEVLCVRLIPFSRASEELKNEGRSLSEQLAHILYSRIGLRAAAETGAFKQYVKEIPFNPVLY
jgi:hypothetical protein